jgi:rhodanese-related sulfurtransferase
MAASAFRTAGYEAYNMRGGILAWVEAGLPIEPDDGYVAEH